MEAPAQTLVLFQLYHFAHAQGDDKPYLEDYLPICQLVLLSAESAHKVLSEIFCFFADTGGCHAGLPMHTVHQAADFLRSATHLSLFGFDMVVRNGTGTSGM